MQPEQVAATHPLRLELFELLRLLPYNEPEEAIDASLLLSCCGAHALGAQLAADVRSAIAETQAQVPKPTDWFLGCAILMANAGTMLRLETIASHNQRQLQTAVGHAEQGNAEYQQPPKFQIVQQIDQRIILRKLLK